MTILAPEPLRVAPIASTNDVAAERWDALAGRGAHLHSWFVAAERSGAQPRHLVGEADGGVIRLIIPVYFMSRADHDLHDRWFGPLRRLTAGLGVRLRPTLAVGTPFVQTSEPVGTIDDAPDATLERIFDLLEEQARRDGARAVVWPFLDPASERLIRLGRNRGYAELYAGASAFLPVEWTSVDEYIDSRSKSVRRTIRVDRRAFDSGGLRTEVIRDFARHAAAAEALFRAFFLRRNGYPSRLPAGFFRQVAERGERGITAQLTWEGTRLVGASFNLTAAGVMDGTFAAVAAGYEGGPVYYNDLIYTPLAAACQEQVHRLELGPTALYAKVLRGAKLRRRITLIRGTTPRRHALLQALGRQVARRTERKEAELLAPLGGFRCFG